VATSIRAGHCGDEARALEEAVLADFTALREGLERAGLEQERRALRLLPRDLHWTWIDDATLELAFSLPPGAYATVVLREAAEY
jgi:tRNA pseudouridine13 synthase